MIHMKIGELPKLRLNIRDTEVIRIGGEPYEGAYDVEPRFYQQTLETTGKILSDDVRVHAIQVENVSNPAGGITVYIGGIING